MGETQIRYAAFTLSVTAAALLTACSKPTDTASSTPAPSAETVPTAPVAPTSAQKKAILASLPAAYQAADLDNGQAKFALCKSCHTIVQGAPGVMSLEKQPVRRDDALQILQR